MNPILKNVLAVIVGSIVGAMANMAVLLIGMALVPLPEGASMENLNAAIPMFEFKHYVTPFLAHAIHAFVAGFIAYKIAASHKNIIVLIVGVLTLIAGIMNFMELTNSPLAFIVIDLVFAYIPMAWLGGKLAKGKTPEVI